jgi:hypothetical protein
VLWRVSPPLDNWWARHTHDLEEVLVVVWLSFNVGLCGYRAYAVTQVNLSLGLNGKILGRGRKTR